MTKDLKAKWLITYFLILIYSIGFIYAFGGKAHADQGNRHLSPACQKLDREHNDTGATLRNCQLNWTSPVTLYPCWINEGIKRHEIHVKYSKECKGG